MRTLIFLATIFTASITMAAGGTSCYVDNDDVVIKINLVNSRTPGAPVAQGSASASIKEHLSTPWNYVVSDMVGWWSSNSEIKMAFYKEIPTPTSYKASYLAVEVVRPGDGESAHGVYKIREKGQLVASGAISCSFE